MNLKSLCILPLILLLHGAYGQEVTDSLSKAPSIEKSFNRKLLVAPAIITNTVGMVYLEYKWWWKGNYHPFTYQYEGFLNNYSFGVDKIGHFYISHLYYHALYNTMKWAGYGDKSSMIVGTAIPAAYALSVELGDGFSSYNFSPDDLASNLIGIGYGVLQTKVPFFKNFEIKWSYYPSSWALYKDPKISLTDDYDGHVYWLSCNVHKLLPMRVKNYWPRFLNLAVGYGVKNEVPGVNSPEARKFTFGIDYNFSALPLKGSTWKLTQSILDLFHFPAPGIRKIQGEKATYKVILLN